MSSVTLFDSGRRKWIVYSILISFAHSIWADCQVPVIAVLTKIDQLYNIIPDEPKEEAVLQVQGVFADSFKASSHPPAGMVVVAGKYLFIY
jgi:hypothetical protein